ncbi:MAG: hypothetical protein COT81_01530 [Candidatus Buchananbacteria bacterium CG10_big_fil_rev_8_21_14_0_10_42_9]|uniref:Uncharacterized protein n=1 Tax=Candidatus Buchananbacteria bacterium CG10_big_fil_rev_8_21_14_0_10_42_9 TaxID=1974526 RepID=A0A2H0W1W8_9BACT|nr:MAG: hypothetical protein COT81_01530 [Candidatus Buchananbacteria bacterium CG10_big_fil_rev_8_21_14_0_10_42_9]
MRKYYQYVILSLILAWIFKIHNEIYSEAYPKIYPINLLPHFGYVSWLVVSIILIRAIRIIKKSRSYASIKEFHKNKIKRDWMEYKSNKGEVIEMFLVGVFSLSFLTNNLNPPSKIFFVPLVIAVVMFPFRKYISLGIVGAYIIIDLLFLGIVWSGGIGW